jgi:hypothetical protein
MSFVTPFADDATSVVLARSIYAPSSARSAVHLPFDELELANLPSVCPLDQPEVIAADHRMIRPNP